MKPHFNLAALIAAFTLTVSAQEAAKPAGKPPENKPASPPTPGQAQTLPEIVVTATALDQAAEVGAKFPVSSKDIPQAIQTLDRATLDDRDVRNIADALELVPSATSGEGNLSSFPEFSYLIRGQSARVLRDGVRHRFFEGNDANAFWMIDRVEVLKGPQGVLYGFGGFGGAINLVTKAPLKEWHGEAMSRWDSLGARAGGVDVGGPLNKEGTLRFRLNGEIEESELFVDDVDLNRRNFDFQLAWDATPSLHFNFETAYLEREQTSYPGLPLTGTVRDTDEISLSLRRNFGDPDYQLQTTGWFYRFGAEYDFDEDWKLSLTTHLHTFNQDSTTTSLGNRIPSTLTVPRSYRETHESDWESSVDLRLTGEFDTGPVSHSAALGAVGNIFRGGFYGDYGLSDQIIGLRSSAYGLPRPATARGFVIPDDRDRLDSLGIYAQDLVALTERWKALLGVRYDWVEHDTQFDSTFFKADYKRVTWQAGTTFDVSEGVTLFTGYSTGFNPDNVLFFPLADGSSFKPETSWQVEGGVKLTHDWLSGTISGFHIVRENVVTSDPSDPFGYRASGEQTTDGIELELTAELARGWKAGLGYAWLDATVSADPVTPVGNSVPNVAEHNVRAFTRYVVGDGTLKGLGFSAALNWTGDRFGTLDNDYTMPSYTTLDLGVSYQRANWRADIFVSNVTDERYFRNGGSTTVFPGEPLSVNSRVSFKF